MPNIATHQRQAKHNYEFLQTFIADQNYKDWQITVAYYTALHIFEAEATRKNPTWRAGKMTSNSTSPHTWRSTYINIEFRDISRYYRLLEERSREARYLQNLGDNKIASEAISDSDTKQCIKEYLQKIIDKFGYSW